MKLGTMLVLLNVTDVASRAVAELRSNTQDEETKKHMADTVKLIRETAGVAIVAELEDEFKSDTNLVTFLDKLFETAILKDMADEEKFSTYTKELEELYSKLVKKEKSNE